MRSHRVVYTPEAEAQLIDLYRYIASAASPNTSRRFTDAIMEQCEKLSTFPNRGTARDDIRSGLRTLPFRRVVIAYAVDASDVTIVGIFYGGQDYESILDDS
jgi:toxin ParE1/3/4